MSQRRTGSFEKRLSALEERVASRRSVIFHEVAPGESDAEVASRLAASDVKGDRVIFIRLVPVDARWRWLLSQNYEAMGANVIDRGAFADWARGLAPDDRDKLLHDAVNGKGPFAACAPDSAADLDAMLPELEEWRRTRARN